MSQVAVIETGKQLALFLDVDGTLLEIAQTPEQVEVPQQIKDLLLDLIARFDGAVALVSGRRLDELDRLFAPLKMCAAGVHGCERREASGCVVRPMIEREELAAARFELAQFVAMHDGLLLEDKGYALAVHFRRVPLMSGAVHQEMKRALMRVGPRYALLAGKCVFELRPIGVTKGTAIAAYMHESLFAGRTPVFIGDDLTDEDGFAVVNALGGISIGVGDVAVSNARHRLANVREVWRWLASLPVPLAVDSSVDATRRSERPA